MPLTIVTSDRFEDHLTPPGHPESAERATVLQVVASRWRERAGAVVEARPATREELLRVHRPEYLDAIARTAGRAVALDPDTFTSPASYEVALLAAGAAIRGVELVMDGEGPLRTAALVRPPGHHAEARRAMGFCLFNNAAAAAAHARARGAERVAVLDYDVHHGNGTQWMFYEDPSVLYVSTHQYPYYPGTGAAEDVGAGDGAGFTVNVPIEAGATDADYERVFTDLIEPVLEQFSPDLIVVSAGFDAHERDPLAGMRLSTEGYAILAARAGAIADRCCGGRLVMVTEGGYDLGSLTACLEGSLSVLDGREPDGVRATRTAAPSPRGANAVVAVRAAHRRYWQL